jgi:hypothetical protein
MGRCFEEAIKKVRLLATKTRKYKEKKLKDWIPAFAGMTNQQTLVY